MMKSKNSIKLLAITCLFFLCGVNSYAQKKDSKTDALKGIWQLSRFTKQGDSALIKRNALKFYDGFGNFYVLSPKDSETLTTDFQGEYKILSGNEYLETINDSASIPKGTRVKLQYKIEENDKLLLKFQIGNDTYEEVWNKVKMTPK